MATKKLNQHITRCCGIINVNYEDKSIDDVINQFVVYMNSCDFITEYYIIKHDDTDTLHAHFIIVMSKQLRMSTLLNKLANFLNIDVTCLQIDSLSDLNAYVRYMLHIGEDKKQYSIDDIRSNKGFDYISEIVNSNSANSTLTSMQLIIYVLMYPNRVDLMVAMGLPQYHKYRHEIDVLNDNYMMLSHKYSYLLQNDNNLPF